MNFTLPFEKLSKNDTNIAGGKGASLGEVTQSGIPVPPGYVVLTSAFDQFLKNTDLLQEVRSELNNVDKDKIHTVEYASERIQSIILKAEIPKEIGGEILKEFKILNTEYVAVRSSATAEDSDSAAWAGQLDSFLNITEDTLLQYVKKCLASLFTPRAIFYRFEQGLKESHVSVAVVVQTMVNSEKSGVAFSVHPVTEDPNQLIIEAGFGLGEAIVSGSITPDSYVISKKDWQIVDINVKEQSRKIVRKEGGGSEWVGLNEEEGCKQVIINNEIIELSKLVTKIEKHYGFPCDIEWAIENSILYIVQSRPITTLGSMKNKTGVNTKDEYHKVMNRSMFLLDCEIWDQAERIELPKLCDDYIVYDPIFVYRPGKAITIYYNFSDPSQDTSRLIAYFNDREGYFDNLKKEFDRESKVTRKLTKSSSADDFQALFESIIKIWPLIAISILIGDKDGGQISAKPELIEKSRKLRLENDDLLLISTEALLEKAAQKVPEKYKKWVEFLTYEEIHSGTMPSIVEIKKRGDGYIYHKGVLYLGESLDNYAKRNGFVVAEESVNTGNTSKDAVRGEVVYPGKAKGRVKIVFERKDIGQVKDGDILVTPMTTPNLMPAMKKAAAFVTDEGGVTCHAAIIAREMKKPCIIGTKIATEILKDGDLVEVGADKGVVKILKRWS